MIIIQKISIVLLLGALGCNGSNNRSDSKIEKRPEFNKIRLTDLNEKPINPERYKGKTVFINFWATWCKPCIEEMPSIEKAQNILRDKEVLFLLASGESIEQIKEFERSHNYKFNYVRIENFEELNIQALPTTFIFNPRGNLVFSEMGSRNWDDNNNINMILKIAKQND